MVAATLPCGVLRNNENITILMEPSLFDPRVKTLANAIRGCRNCDASTRSRADVGCRKRQKSDDHSPELECMSRRRKVSDASATDDSEWTSTNQSLDRPPVVKNGTGVYFNSDATLMEKPSGVYFNNRETNCVLHPLQVSKGLDLYSSTALPAGVPLQPAPLLLRGLKLVHRSGPVITSVTSRDSPATLPQDSSVHAAALALSELGNACRSSSLT